MVPVELQKAIVEIGRHYPQLKLKWTFILVVNAIVV